MLNNESLNAQVPTSHTTAVLQDEAIRFSGNLKACKQYWESIPFHCNPGIYSFVVKAIDNKWYLASWMTLAGKNGAAS